VKKKQKTRVKTVPEKRESRDRNTRVWVAGRRLHLRTKSGNAKKEINFAKVHRDEKEDYGRQSGRLIKNDGGKDARSIAFIEGGRPRRGREASYS